MVEEEEVNFLEALHALVKQGEQNIWVVSRIVSVWVGSCVVVEEEEVNFLEALHALVKQGKQNKVLQIVVGTGGYVEVEN